MVRGPRTQPLGDGVPTAHLTPDTHPGTKALPIWTPTPRAERALTMLRDARTALAAALAELEERHPDDGALQARIAVWRRVGGVPFPR